MNPYDEEMFERVDRSVVRKRSIHEKVIDSEFWLSQPPEARIRMVEILREEVYGDEYRKGLQRIYRIVKRP